MGFDRFILIAALVVGHVPAADRIPIIAPYVVAARLAAYLASAIGDRRSAIDWRTRALNWPRQN